MKFQKLAQLDPMNEKLKRHYTAMAGMGESQIVSDSLLRNPADFSSSGGTSEIVPSENGKREIVWRSDFRSNLIVGNPLTRDGEYGPAITDYDRYVTGVDVNETDVVNTDEQIAGGTMLGRYDGSVAPAGMGRQATYGERRGIPHGLPGKFNSDRGMGTGDGKNTGFKYHRPRRAMGFDFSWGGITDAISNVVDQTGDQLVNSLPAELADQLKEDLVGGGTVTSSSGGTIYVSRPVTGTTTTTTKTIMAGVPNWALYAGGGLIGLSFLLILVKAMKAGT